MVLTSTQQPQQSRHFGQQKKLRNARSSLSSQNLPAQPESQSFPGLLCLDGLLLPDGCVRVCSEGGTQRKKSTAVYFMSAPATPAASCQLDPLGAQLEDKASAPCTPSVREVTTPRNRAFGTHRACYFSASKPAPSVPSLPIKRVLEDANDGSDAELTTSIMPYTPKCSRRAPPNPFAEDASPSVAPSPSSAPHSSGPQTCSRSSSFANSTNPSAPPSCSSSQSLPQQPQQQQHRPSSSGGPVSAGSSAAAASAALDSFLLMGLPSICCPRPSVLPPLSVCPS